MARFRARGYVYFVQAEANGLIKIGTTSNHPDKRLAELRTVSPVPLIPLGIVAGNERVERAMHLRFAHHRAHGEWFRPGQDLLDFVGDYVRPWPKVRFGDCGIRPDGWESWLARQMADLERRAVQKWQIRNFGRVLWAIGDMLTRAFPGVPERSMPRDEESTEVPAVSLPAPVLEIPPEPIPESESESAALESVVPEVSSVRPRRNGFRRARFGPLQALLDAAREETP